MKDVLIKSRQAARKHSFKTDITPCVIVSIDTDGVRNRFNANEMIKAVKAWTFDDVSSGEDVMTAIQANEIACFVKTWIDNVDTIIVHCDAGISRSSGVGAAIMKWYNGDDSSVFDNGNYCPNMLCYRLMLNALSVDASDDDVSERWLRSCRSWCLLNPI